MEQFQADGYEGTSVQDLVDATGVSRSSLYDTFGPKDQLYLAALDHYHEQQIQSIADRLRANGSPLARIRAVLETAAQGCEEGRGCLLVDAAIERSRHCDDTGRHAATGLRGLEAAFAEAVRRAQQAGEVPEQTAPMRAGRALTNAYCGLSVTARLGPASGTDDVIESLLAALRSGCVPEDGAQ